MKKSFIAMAAFFMLLTGCHKEENGNRDGEKVKLTASLSQGEATKVDVEPGDKGVDVYWTNGDNVSVFGMTQDIRSYLGKIATTLAERSKKATFEGEVTSSQDNAYYVFYPYNVSNEENSGTSISLNLETQNGKVDDFTWMSNYMYMFGKESGQMDNNNQVNFSMEHACALLQFNVKLKDAKEGIKLKSIAVSGDNIKSKKTLHVYDKTISDVDGSGNKITLLYPEGGSVLGTDAVMALMSAFPAGSGNVDVSVTVDNNGTEQTVAIPGVTVAFEAGKRYTKELELNLPEPEEIGVYVTGYENNVAKVWKNGQELYALTDGTQAWSVYVSGNDVYAAGDEVIDGIRVAKVWKNGQELYALTDGIRSAYAYSVYVSGSDVYAAGNNYKGTKTVAKVWKNGQELYDLTDGTQNAYAWSVYVSGSDVYAAGYDNVAKVWKNGQELYALTDGTQEAYAYSVFIQK